VAAVAAVAAALAVAAAVGVLVVLLVAELVVLLVLLVLLVWISSSCLSRRHVTSASVCCVLSSHHRPVLLTLTCFSLRCELILIMGLH
jgi:hypothetical protein